MTPLVQEILKRINVRVNVSTGGTSPRDDSFIKTVFKWLHSQSEVLDSDEIAQWAMDNKWNEKYAKKLGDLAEKIGKDGRVVIKYPPSLPVDYYDEVKKEAEKINYEA